MVLVVRAFQGICGVGRDRSQMTVRVKILSWVLSDESWTVEQFTLVRLKIFSAVPLSFRSLHETSLSAFDM